MTITLSPEQEAQIKTRVARGDFASVEEAARQLVDEALAERALDESDDLAWAKPYVDEALAEVARGEEITLEEHKARNSARLAALRTSWRASSSHRLRTRTPPKLLLIFPPKPGIA